MMTTKKPVYYKESAYNTGFFIIIAWLNLQAKCYKNVKKCCNYVLTHV